MFQPTLKLALRRKSVRSYDGTPLTEAERGALTAFTAEDAANPWGIPIAFRLLSAAEHGLTSPVLTGADVFLAAAAPRVPHAEEAFGYSFERAVLYACSIGLSTVWIGGTMNRPAFEKAMGVTEETFMPCVTPVGHGAGEYSVRERMMRAGVRADSRLRFERLFFKDVWSAPLTPGEAGELMPALESARWAPSAVNKQPWRVIVTKDAAHFYEKKGKGFVSHETGDLQKVDLGIALCHFMGTLAAAGLRAELVLEDPGLTVPEGVEYIASCRLG